MRFDEDSLTLVEIRTTESSLFLTNDGAANYSIDGEAAIDETLSIKSTKDDPDGVKTIRMEYPKLYGYFDKDGKVYKIYQPSQKKYKFIKINAHLQGFDQLEYNQPYLVICSSLKDAMCLSQFNYNLEVIAPDSENTVIKPCLLYTSPSPRDLSTTRMPYYA